MLKLRLFRMCLLIAALVVVVGVVGAQDRTYRVRPGDNLQSIANAYGVTVEALVIHNNLPNQNTIYSGQVLHIPSAATYHLPTSHVVRHGERLVDIAYRYGITVDTLVALNNITNASIIYPGDVLTLPFSQHAPQPVLSGGHTQGHLPTSYVAYIVDVGETLQTIARRFGTTWQILAAVNNIPNPNYIQAGQQIIIPAAGTVVTMQPASPTYHVPVVQTNYRVYIVHPRDTLSQIAEYFGVTVEGIRALNGLSRHSIIYPGDRLLIPNHGHYPPPVHRPIYHGYYTVQYGDTLLEIAAHFGVDVYNIARANGIFNLNSIYAGQSLLIPGYH